jgi:hypothetical protein
MSHVNGLTKLTNIADKIVIHCVSDSVSIQPQVDALYAATYLKMARALKLVRHQSI